MGKIASDATMLRRVKADLVSSRRDIKQVSDSREKLLGLAVAQGKEIESLRAEVLEWKVRFDVLMRRDDGGLRC